MFRFFHYDVIGGHPRFKSRCGYAKIGLRNPEELKNIFQTRNRNILQCTACSNTFPSKSRMAQHVRIHTGEKTF